LPFLIPLPHIAHETGWIAAEVGRQPWIIYQMMKTSDAASVVVSAGEITFSLIMFSSCLSAPDRDVCQTFHKNSSEGAGGLMTMMKTGIILEEK